MGAHNTDGGDTVERNYTVSSSILDLVVNYLEEALQIIGNPSEKNPKAHWNVIGWFELFHHQIKAKLSALVWSELELHSGTQRVMLHCG